MRSIFTILFLLPVMAFAHGYWIETEGTHQVNERVTIKLIFGEYSSGERLSGASLDRMKEIKLFVLINGEKQPVAMQQLNDYWKGEFIPASEGSYIFLAVNEEREVQDWNKHNLGITRPVQYLKNVYQVGSTITKQTPSSFIDALINGAGTDYSIQVFKNKVPFATAKVTVTDAGGNEKIIVLDAGGKANFELSGHGLYVIDVEWIDKTPGTFKEKEYASVRYKLDYSIYQ